MEVQTKQSEILVDDNFAQDMLANMLNSITPESFIRAMIIISIVIVLIIVITRIANK